MNHRSHVFVAFIVLAALGLPAGVMGHQPTVAEEDIRIDKPRISHAIYGEFVDGDEVFTVRLSYEEGWAQPYELLVPHQERWRDHRPHYAVIGPGLPAPTDDEVEQLPVEVPEGAGVYLDRNEGERDVFFESFTRRTFWSSGTVALPLDPGEARIVIWSPEGSLGDFVIGFGVEEDFSDGFGDVFANWSTFAY